MKKWVLLLVLLLVVTGVAQAIPNPSAVYCILQGYEYEIRTDEQGNQYGVCVFPDGSECGGWDYYCKCELNGIGCWPGNFTCHWPCKEMRCKEAGESVLVSKCCEGLDEIYPAHIFDANCNELGLVGWLFLCSDCGNGICESWESKCNCPEDCAQPRIIYVDADGTAEFDNIQAAIDDSNDSDTILVADGIYTGVGNRDIDFLGKAIMVRSENGSENCVIDCNGTRTEPHRGFYFHSGEDADSILSGLTITNGYAENGGGIDCYNSSPTISECVLTHNEAGYYGGGIHCYYNTLSKPSIMRCIIAENKAVIGGGLAFCNGIISECVISKNQAIEGGGLTGCGGKIRDCVINGNMAHAWAGGFQHCDGQIVNCIVSGNIGGGFFACNGEIWNCTVVGNTYDGFFACWQGPITNCIIRDNYRSEVAHPQISVSYSNIKGGWPGEGNIDADPCFVMPGYWDANGTPEDANDDFWVDGDYHLQSAAGRWDPNNQSWVQDAVTSPCIDAGDPMSPIGYEPFPNGGIINMGAYGGTAEASKSYFGEPLCETIVAGDINGDCKVDFLDFRLMALHWLEER